MKHEANFTVVFETGRPYEILMVISALEENNIPVYGQQVSSSGMVTAMPPTPVAFPGTTWVARVPESVLSDAQSIISELPIQPEASPGSWHFNQHALDQPVWKVGKWILVAWLVFLGFGFLRDLFFLSIEVFR